MPSFIRQAMRYVTAVVFAPVIGSVTSIPFAFALDVLWGGDVTGGRWPFTLPNVVLAVIQASAMGLAAGWIAGRRGKLMAALADFFLLTAFVVVSLILNRDLLGGTAQFTDTKPALWVWIGLVPALITGHLAVKYKHLGFGSVLLAVGMAMLLVAQIGAAAFHFYTCIVAYEVKGTGPAVLAFLFPVISEFWWVWWAWGLAGTFWNLYTLRFLLLIGWGLCGFLLAAFGGHLDEKRQRQRLQSDGGVLAESGRT